MYLCYSVVLDVIVFNILNLMTHQWKKIGLARHLQLSCTVYLYSHKFFTSKQTDLQKKNKWGQKIYDVNVRAVNGGRQVGTGHEHLNKLCFYLNLPELMLSNNYKNNSLKLKETVKRVTEKSMSIAPSKLCGAADSADLAVSVDRTW